MYRISIIDDELRAAQVLESLLQAHFPAPMEIQITTHPLKAVSHLEDFQPDLLFLDIKMPGQNGFEVLGGLTKRPFHLIFVTAHDHFAIQAIKANALDYLLKPVDENELVAAINRFMEFPQSESARRFGELKSQNTDLKQENKIAISNMERTLLIDVHEIVRCEAEGNYTYLYFADGSRLLSSKTLKDHAEQLIRCGHIRVHKSHLINPHYVRSLSGRTEIQMADGSDIPIARRRRSDVISFIIDQQHVL